MQLVYLKKFFSKIVFTKLLFSQFNYNIILELKRLLKGSLLLFKMLFFLLLLEKKSINKLL